MTVNRSVLKLHRKLRPAELGLKKYGDICLVSLEGFKCHCGTPVYQSVLSRGIAVLDLIATTKYGDLYNKALGDTL